MLNKKELKGLKERLNIVSKNNLCVDVHYRIKTEGDTRSNPYPKEGLSYGKVKKVLKNSLVVKNDCYTSTIKFKDLLKITADIHSAFTLD